MSADEKKPGGEGKEETAESKGGDEKQKDAPITLLEKFATAVSALLVCAIIAVLVRDAAQEDAPPRFAVTLGHMSIVTGTYRVPATVHDLGDKSAKAVLVHLELVIARNDSVAAASDVTVDWLPGQSSRDVVGLFALPGSGERANIRAEVRGYAVP